MVCPAFTALSSVAAELKGSNVKLGAQDMWHEDSGAFTGEISPIMLKDIRCEYAIIGHSERRHIIGESDELINKKVKAAVKHGLIPILCVGETLDERESGKAKSVVKRQIAEGLKGVDGDIVIAYEPVWAIGTGKTATPSQAEEMHAYIRGLIKDTKTRIIYGGSIKPENMKELMSCENIDGGLVGGASLEAKSFSEIVWY